jgi:hypothetical protein
MDRRLNVENTGGMASAGYLVGPDGLRVEPIALHGAHLAMAKLHHPHLQPDDTVFLVTRHGKLVCYCRDIEDVAEIIDLTQLHGPDEAGEVAG